jgi:hypothetical protein
VRERSAVEVCATMRIALLVVALGVQFGLCARQLGGGSHVLSWIAFVVLGCVSVVCVPWVVRGRALPRVVVAVGVPGSLVSAWLASGVVVDGLRFQVVDWAFGLVGWHLVLLLLDRLPVLLAAMGAHLGVSAVQFLPASVAEVGAAGSVVFGAVSLQLAVVVITRMLVRSRTEAVAAAAEHDRQAARVRHAEQWEREQRTAFAGQLGAVLPLLVDLADGVLDPREEDTRRRCSLAATQLRRLFAEHDEVPDPLVHEITACVVVAERRGLQVSLAVGGAPADVPAEVRRALIGPVAASLAAARVRAKVSVLRTGDDVRVAVVGDAADSGTEPGISGVEVSRGAYGAFVRTETRLRRS